MARKDGQSKQPRLFSPAFLRQQLHRRFDHFGNGRGALLRQLLDQPLDVDRRLEGDLLGPVPTAEGAAVDPSIWPFGPITSFFTSALLTTITGVAPLSHTNWR